MDLVKLARDRKHDQKCSKGSFFFAREMPFFQGYPCWQNIPYGSKYLLRRYFTPQIVP